jgi:SAM-dependent methyltransferase
MPLGLVSLPRCRHLLACPRCRGALENLDGQLRCADRACGLHEQPFEEIAGRPVLVDFDASVVSWAELRAMRGASALRRDHGLVGRLRRWAIIRLEAPNTVAATTVQRLLDLVGDHDGSGEPVGRPPLVLVIGGGEQGFGLDALYASPDVDVLAFDIYASPLTQLIADAHNIPLASESVDAVIIQAVLEHVLEPWTVVEELHRVLKPDGVVYSDVPFMYPVHEGPYDFMRFTDSGHRALYRDFDVVESGVLRGSGTYLSWSFLAFVTSLTRARAVGWAARLATVWLPRLDRVVESRRSLDAAASVFLLARKSTVRASPKELIAYYQGAQVPRTRPPVRWRSLIRGRPEGSATSVGTAAGSRAGGAWLSTSRPAAPRTRGSGRRRPRPATPSAGPAGQTALQGRSDPAATAQASGGTPAEQPD